LRLHVKGSTFIERCWVLASAGGAE